MIHIDTVIIWANYTSGTLFLPRIDDGSFLLDEASSGYKYLNNIDLIYRNPNHLNKNPRTII
jgi:hypothetical protein